MKKLFSLALVLLLCVSMVFPVFAAEDNFVPSITYKPNPELVPVVGEDGKEYIGIIRDADGNVVSYVSAGCLRITPIAHLWDEEEQVPDVIRNLLQFVYDSLNSGDMEIPYEKHNAGLEPSNMVIRDLFDARWSCEDHPKMLEPEGVVLELTFDLGVVADAQIFTQTYDEAMDDWEPIVGTVNNGDGTVTCIFEHLCAIEFSMPLTPVTAPVEVEKTVNLLPWIILLIVAALMLFFFIVYKKKKKVNA